MKKQTSKLLSLIIALNMIIAILPRAVFASSGTLTGTGTLDDPYLIKDILDLKKFRDMANAEASSEICGKLEADIDLKNEEWMPFSPESGYVTEAFAGTFDGDGHIIMGLHINTSSSNQGLFGIINGAEIKNLRVEGSVISSGNYVGGIVGKVQQGTIENCSFSGSVLTAKSKGYAGGIAGYTGNSASQKASILNCANMGNVTGNASGTVGGIVGYAKYTEFINCYNTGSIDGASRSGGIAGQLQNNCSASSCYNIGTISGSSTGADICDFLYSSSKLTNCYYKTQANGAGTGTADNCGEITDADTLLERLGNAFAADENSINNGYPILTWQVNSVPVQKDPHIIVSGSTMLYMTNNGTIPQTTLTAQYIDIEEQSPIVWTVKDESGIISLESPENADESNSIIVVKAQKPGKAIVVAATADNAYTAECEISVMPFITTVEIDGTAAVGQTVYAHVNVLGGDEYDYEVYPELKLQWKYITNDDYSSGNTGSSSYKEITGAVSREFNITDELSGHYLSFSIWYNGEYITPNRPVRIISKDAGIVSADKSALEIDTSDIKGNKAFIFPASGANGSSIKWESSDNEIINTASGVVVLPAEGIAQITLTAVISYGEASDKKEFTVKVYSEKAIAEENANKQFHLEKAIASLGDYYKIYPVCGTDTNIIDILKSDLAEKGYENIDISVKSAEEIYGGAGIDNSGNITYFYADPNSAPAVKMGSFNVIFSLTKDDALAELEVPVIIYWDVQKVKAVMKDEILDRVSDESILGDNSEADAVTENLILPRIADEKKWTQISWTSSDENIISVSDENQSSADALFDPYIGIIKRGIKDEQVTLTANFTFMLTNDVTGSEAPITMTKVFTVTVKALSKEEIDIVKRQLEEKLDSGFEKAGIIDGITGEMLKVDNDKYTAYNDIKIPTTHDFDVDGKYYPISIGSSDDTIIKAPDVNNAANIEVFRPAVGKADAEATLTVSISDKDTNITASKFFNIIVPALTEEEVYREKALMEKVKAAYFDGIKGANNDPDNISENLASFIEVYEENGSLVWVRDNKNTVNHGIVPVAMDGWEELEAWRLFKSSNPAAVTHENLLVTIQKNAKAVTISSALSSKTLGKYGELYKKDSAAYGDYAQLADLYYQEVSADLVIRGTSTPANVRPIAVSETIDVSFRLQSSNSTLIPKVSYVDLDETTTVFDIFNRALSENNYTYKKRGSYVYSITTPDKMTLEELDEGENSGWMYKVNGIIPDVYMGAYGLKDGDEIVVFFTKDYTEEKGYSHGSGGLKSSVSKVTNTENKVEDKINENDNLKENTDNISSVYNDISGHWAENPIKYVSEKGLMKGIGNNKFAPEVVLNRAMFVTILYRIENEPEAEASQFTDVKSGSWYERAVSWASANGIVSGISAKEFAPDNDITREQMAAIIYRYAQYKGLEAVALSENLSRFSDESEISEYALAAMNWAVGQSLIIGISETMLSPRDNTTRAQAAVVFMRMLENLK